MSEPVSDYTRFVCDGTFTNVAAGEQVRWLPRRRASDIALPGKDFWLFDDHVIRSVGREASDDPAAPKLCATVFDEAWAKAVPHDQYEIHEQEYASSCQSLHPLQLGPHAKPSRDGCATSAGRRD